MYTFFGINSGICSLGKQVYGVTSCNKLTFSTLIHFNIKYKVEIVMFVVFYRRYIIMIDNMKGNCIFYHLFINIIPPIGVLTFEIQFISIFNYFRQLDTKLMSCLRFLALTFEIMLSLFFKIQGIHQAKVESFPVRTGKLQLQGRTVCLTIVTSEWIELTYIDPRTSYIILKV